MFGNIEYLNADTSKLWVIDIEADSLTPSVIHVLCGINVKTGEEVRLSSGIKEWINDRKDQGCRFIGHNIIGYDAYCLNKLLQTRLTIADLIDTLVLSMVFSPSLAGGHSLGSYGTRFNYPKGEFNDWSKYSLEME